MSELQRVPDAGLPAGYADQWRQAVHTELSALSGRLTCARCSREYRTRGGLTYLECGHDIGLDPTLLRLASLHRELGLALAAFAGDAMPSDAAAGDVANALHTLIVEETVNRSRIPRC